MNFESVHNYYERLVFDEIVAKGRSYDLPGDPNLIEDIACVALNRLPARYIRFDIDLVFYMTSDEREKVERTVQEAVKYAVDFVKARTKEQGGASAT